MASGALEQATLFLIAALAAVPLCRVLGVSPVLGYLAAGLIIGPEVAGLVEDVEALRGFSELGVVFLLFVIGIELQPRRLWVLRHSIFTQGAVQVGSAALALGAAAAWLLDDWRAGAVIGVGLSLSSTAFVLQTLSERKALASRPGRAAFGILLFQDLAVVPALALVPLLARGEPAVPAVHWLDALAPLGALAALGVLGHFLLRPLLRLVAWTGIHELFTAAALLLVIGSAAAMEELGLSMGLGGFLAGVLVADSEYRHQLEADIQPFRGILLGLFFMVVGMAVDLSLLADHLGVIVAATLGLLGVKAVLLLPVARLGGLAGHDRVTLAVLLAQGGEFAFLIFGAAAGAGILGETLAGILVLTVTLSMALTPVLVALDDRAIARLERRAAPAWDPVPDALEHEVVIAGFGRFGQIVGRMLSMAEIPFTAIEKSYSQVDFVRSFGHTVYYGDASRLTLLRAAKLDQAKAVVVAVDDSDDALAIVELVRRHFPGVRVLARARNRRHQLALMDHGCQVIVREMLLSSLELAGEVLQALGYAERDARRAMHIFREHDARTLARQQAIHHDEAAWRQSALEAADELRTLFEADDVARAERRRRSSYG